MPAWLLAIILNYIVPMAARVIAIYGIKALEDKAPELAPILDELLMLLGKDTQPSPKLAAAADTFSKA